MPAQPNPNFIPPNQTPAQNPPQAPQMSKDERVGYHKGSLSTLLGERNELLKMISVVDQLIQAHAKELESLGVNLQQTQ